MQLSLVTRPPVVEPQIEKQYVPYMWHETEYRRVLVDVIQVFRKKSICCIVDFLRISGAVTQVSGGYYPSSYFEQAILHLQKIGRVREVEGVAWVWSNV